MVPAGRFPAFASLIVLAASLAVSLVVHPGSARAGSPAAGLSTTTTTPAAVRVGGHAPDFDVATTPYGWRRFSQLCRQGAIALVFDPDETTLLAIEREARQFAGLGVSVTVVRRHSDGDNWDALARLGLSVTLLSDPKGYVAELFGLPAGDGTPAGPSWCLVDRGGIVRHFATGLAPELLAADIGAHVKGARSLADGIQAR